MSQNPAPPAQASTLADIIDRVLADASRAYGDTIAYETLAGWAEQAVTELWGDSVRVTSFLPLLAMRRIDVLAAAQPAAFGV